MAETTDKQVNKAKTWIRQGTIFSIAQGTILVKKSVITGKIKVLGTPGTISSQKTRLIDMPISELEDLKRKGGTPTLHGIIDNIIKVKKGERAETPEMKKYVIDRGEVIRKKVQAKLGIHIRWPWQSVLVLPLGEQTIDTPSIEVDNKDRIRIGIDTDYRYAIYDPAKYSGQLVSAAEAVGAKNASAEIGRRIGQSLDTIVRDEAKNLDMDKFNELTSSDLQKKFQRRLIEIGSEYGIEITKFFVTNVRLPKQIIDAEEKKRAAEAEKQAKIMQGEGDASIITSKVNAVLKALQIDPSLINDNQRLQMLADHLYSQSSRNIIVKNGNPVNVDSNRPHDSGTSSTTLNAEDIAKIIMAVTANNQSKNSDAVNNDDQNTDTIESEKTK